MGLKIRIRKKAFALLPLVLMWGGAVSVPLAGAQTDKREIIRQARHSYYSLRGLGLSEFQVKVQPNWGMMLKGVESNTDSMRMLNGLRFSMLLGPDGKVKVDHEATIPPSNPQAEEGVKQIFSGMEQMLSGLFATWNLFMLESPFPPAESQYELNEQAAVYVLTYKEGSADITTTMTRDLAITEIKVSSPDFTSLVKPRFVKTEKGNVLRGYGASYTPTTGPGKVEMNVQIDYSEISGMQLPQKVHFSSTYDGNPNETELIFSDYKVKVR
jgi:hypothetical protein